MAILSHPRQTSADGPWHVAPWIRVVLMGGGAERAAALAAALAAAGLPVAEASALPASRWHDIVTESAASGIDALVVEDLTLVSPGTVAELRRVAETDPMIVAVSPRFSSSAAGMIVAAGPAVSYGLLPDRRCLYLKASALAECDLSSSEAGEPLTGALLALNRIGFRAVMAGRAIAQHPEGVRPLEPEGVPADWRPALRRQSAAAPMLAETVMAGLRPGSDGRRAIAFDLSHVGPRHSGTTWLARSLVGRAALRWPDLAVHVVATPDTFAFHFAGLDGQVTRADPADGRCFAALIRLGQPFLWKEVDAAVRRAPVLVLLVLDTIGLDCQHDAPDELDALWRFCIAEADGLLFNSAFTARQFARRFVLPGDQPARVSLHSLDLADYRTGGDRSPERTDAPAGSGVLVIGNALPHKRLAETARWLASAGLAVPITVLGLAPGAVPGVTSLSSGSVSAERMASLYAAARLVIYPSVYEGFGFPILDALAHRRPILVRPLEPYREIVAGLPEAANVHTYATPGDLLRLVRDPPAWTEARVDGPVRNWDDATDDLRAVLDEALLGADEARVVRRIDALRGRMSFMRSLTLGDGGDDLDRLAGLAGRGMRAGVLWLGRRLPGAGGLARLASRAFGPGRRGGSPP